MEIEKTTTIDAPIQKVWSMMFDLKLVAGCIPGVQSLEAIGENEYLMKMSVKVGFINARFNSRIKIVEMTPPSYVRSEGTGEDSSVASSLKMTTEAFLSPNGDSKTDVRLKVKVELFGRLGTFGLNAIKTKADRMWEESCRNLAERIQGSPT